ncbi:MAG: response regulator, partial [Treponema sp.]|nr:response regulator [Treponema sp.]
MLHLQKLVSELLPDAEIKALTSSDEAIIYSNDNRIDIAFLDIRMMGISGVELASILRENYPKVNI